MNGESGISFKELFNKDIDRNINGVIKANDEKNLNDEVNEYVLTEEICRNLAKFLDAYNDPSNHEQNGAWISGFFGSGKSHLLKMLSHILGEVPAELVDKGNKPTMSREQIVHAFMGKAEAQDDQMLAGQLEKALTIPATSILFNIDQKADKSNASDMLLYAFVRVFVRRVVSTARIHTLRNSNAIWRAMVISRISNKSSSRWLANHGAKAVVRPCYGMMRSAKPMPR